MLGSDLPHLQEKKCSFDYDGLSHFAWIDKTIERAKLWWGHPWMAGSGMGRKYYNESFGNTLRHCDCELFPVVSFGISRI
jgi:hypothetical protein